MRPAWSAWARMRPRASEKKKGGGDLIREVEKETEIF